jgi:hypothetical protein
MSSYRYVVFPRGKQPTAAEVAQLQSVADALGGRFAWGTCRDEPRLAVAFEAPTFDHVLKSDASLERLIAKWQSHGCELLDHLKFVKDPAALKPKGAPRSSSPRSSEPRGSSPRSTAARSASEGASNPTHTPTLTRLSPETSPTTDSPDSLIRHSSFRHSSFDYHSSLARSLLSLDRTLERYNLIVRLAAAAPYVMMAAAALLTITLGLYARDRLMNTGREPRQQTIERLASPPAEEQHPSF